MRNRFSKRLTMMSSLCTSSLLAGCMTVAPLEPVKNAPLEYRGDNTVAVEFVSPMLVGARCAQRGAHIFGVPQINSMGCGDDRMITMPNPCQTLTSGWYARLLCHELAHANGWSRTHEGGSFLPDEWAGVDPQAVALSETTINHFRRGGALKPASQSPQALALAAQRARGDENDVNDQAAVQVAEVEKDLPTRAEADASESSSSIVLASVSNEVEAVTAFKLQSDGPESSSTAGEEKAVAEVSLLDEDVTQRPALSSQVSVAAADAHLFKSISFQQLPASTSFVVAPEALH